MKSRLFSFQYWWHRSFLFQIVIISLLVFGSRSVIADWNYVPSGSMNPTILEGDAVFVNRLAYDVRVPFTTVNLWKRSDPHRGEVVIFYSPVDGTRLVKRVIGEPGDVVAMLNGILHVNGVAANFQKLVIADAGILSENDNARHQLGYEQLENARHLIMRSDDRIESGDFLPIEVPEANYFVLGDHRDNSADSRYIGFVPRKNIVGKAVGILASFDQDNVYMPRWQRFFSSLD